MDNHMGNENEDENIDINNNEINNNIYDFIEQNFGRTLSPIEYNEISNWQDNELTRYAIKQAVLTGAYNLKYIKSILLNYEKNSITTVQQAQEENNNFKNKQNGIIKPSWIDKKIDIDVPTEAEEKEIKDFLEDFD